MKKCQKCEEVLMAGWELCWKCGHDHNKETNTSKEPSIKSDLDLNKKIRIQLLLKNHQLNLI